MSYFTNQNVEKFIMLMHILCLLLFKDTLKVFDDFKNKQKSVWSNVHTCIETKHKCYRKSLRTK